MKPLLLPYPQAQQQTRLGRTTLSRLVNSGEIASVKVGKARRIPISALEKWIAEQSGVSLSADETEDSVAAGHK